MEKNSRWPGEILKDVEDGVEMVYDQLGRRQKEGDQEDDKVRQDLLHQQPLTPATDHSIAQSVLRIQDVYPRIPDLGSRIQQQHQKRRGENTGSRNRNTGHDVTVV
jgi:hypothetical protein